ncbi:MAG: TIM barrel protein, partial [Gemmatimonadetes bacterium]|nr:TIM barrel protein [Gemmatimonadota bacterium]
MGTATIRIVASSLRSVAMASGRSKRAASPRRRVYRRAMSAIPHCLVVAALLLVSACTRPAAADRQSLRFGIAAFGDIEPLRQAEAIAAMGFDYLEPGLASAVAMSEPDRAAIRDRLARLGIRIEVMNWFLPPDLKVTGPAVDRARIRAYLEQALAVAESFGAEVIVFGSPAARSHPADF